MEKFLPNELGNAKSGISQFISDDILIKYNWDGTSNKLSLKKLYLFYRVIYRKFKVFY